MGAILKLGNSPPFFDNWQGVGNAEQVVKRPAPVGPIQRYRHAGPASAVLLFLAYAGPIAGQDQFPDPVPDSGIRLSVEEVAVIPDSSAGRPPRVSVVTADPSGRLFANDQRGPVFHVHPETGDVTEYLDLRDYADLALISTFEAGFQSFAFHPDFREEGRAGYGRLYTIHSSTNTTAQPDFDPGGVTEFHTLLLEWRTDNPESIPFDPADPGNPYRELMRLKQPFGNHNAGLIAFNPLALPGSPDYGNLYVAIADGGSGGDPQENGEDPSNPYGAILRINPLGSDAQNGRYGIVPGNALAADNDPGTLAEIYAYGFRNPQRFGWDLATGDLYVADIGQNAVEEINRVVNGGHFGWDIREGSFDFEGGSSAGLIDPVAEYDHANTVSDPPISIANRAVTTGEVIRGMGIPELEGRLPVSDFPTGLIFVLDVDSDPLDGGQDGLSEVKLLNSENEPVRLLEQINAVRADRGLSPSRRADLRFSVNTPGQLYISNKHDGVLRRVLPTTQPSIGIGLDAGNAVLLEFKGLLQQSTDLETWETRIPQPRSPWHPPDDGSAVFYRSVIP